MIEQGIIVSVQGYSLSTAQELAEHAIAGGAVAVRTDVPLDIDADVIGLMKLRKRRFYITTTVKSIRNVSLSADIVAIDSREGNENLEELYEYAERLGMMIVADIQTVQDVKRIIDNDLPRPDYYATTFSFLNHQDGEPDIELIADIKRLTDIPIIAEGGYSTPSQIRFAIAAGAHAVCVGKEITKVKEKTEDFVNYFKNNEVLKCY